MCRLTVNEIIDILDDHLVEIDNEFDIFAIPPIENTYMEKPMKISTKMIKNMKHNYIIWVVECSERKVFMLSAITIFIQSQRATGDEIPLAALNKRSKQNTSKSFSSTI